MAQSTPSSPSPSSPGGNGITGLIRRSDSLSVVMNANPQLGMWQAAGLAIARAPNLNELRDPESGGDNIEFNAQGHSTRVAVQEPDGELTLARTLTSRPSFTSPFTGNAPIDEGQEIEMGQKDGESSKRHGHHHHHSLREKRQQLIQRRRSLYERHRGDVKEKWGPTIMNGLKAFWKFFKTPSGFIITIYFLNIVAWGAMLFFLLLKAAPAMNHPSADDNSSPRKIWLEIDSQILNALFCVTGFGLAPWRFRDLYYFVTALHGHNKKSMEKLCKQNEAWFRPPEWATQKDASDQAADEANLTLARSETFTGVRAPPTPMWKLGFVIWMMVINTLLQAVLSFFMWHYNRIDRPGWATGTFIGLGCGVAMMAGLVSWWEGRKVKKIEGPQVQVVKSPNDVV